MDSVPHQDPGRSLEDSVAVRGQRSQVKVDSGETDELCLLPGFSIGRLLQPVSAERLVAVDSEQTSPSLDLLKDLLQRCVRCHLVPFGPIGRLLNPPLSSHCPRPS